MRYEDFVELDNLTPWDCIILFENEKMRAVINDGRIIDFIKENKN